MTQVQYKKIVETKVNVEVLDRAVWPQEDKIRDQVYISLLKANNFTYEKLLDDLFSETESRVLWAAETMNKYYNMADICVPKIEE